MKRTTAALLPLPLLLGSCALFSGEGLVHGSAQLGGYNLDARGSIDSFKGATAGRMPVEAVGQERSSVTPYGQATLGVLGFDLTASGFQYSQTGTAFFTGNFLGNTYSGPTYSDLEIDNFQVLLGWNPVALGIVEAGILIGLDYYSVDFLVRDVAVPATVGRLDQDFPLPVAGVRVMVWPLPWIGAGGDVVGSVWTVDGLDTQMVDGKLLIVVQPVDHLEAFVGYRYQSLQFEGLSSSFSLVNSDLTFSGIIFGVGAYF